MKHVWDNFLKEMVRPEYIYLVAALSFLSINVTIISGASALIVLLMAIMPWALYGACNFVIYFGAYIVITLWNKLWD